MQPFPLIESLEIRRLLSVASLTAHGVPVAAVEGQAFTQLTLATFKDKTPEAVSAYSTTIIWGDGSSSAGTVIATPDPTAFIVNGSHTYVARGRYRARVVVTETDGDTTHAVSVAKVQDAPIIATGQSVSGISGLAVQGVVATYADADPRAAGGPVAGQVAVIRWGDGTASPGTLAFNASTHLIEVSGKHAYSRARVFSISTVIREAGVIVTPTPATSSATIVAPTPVTTPSLVGDYTGTAKGSGGGFFDKIIGALVGDQSFEFDITAQSLTSLTGTITIAGQSVSGDLPGSLLNNRNFHFLLSGSQGSVDLTGRVSADGKTIAGNIEAKYSGLSDLKLKGTFTASR